MRGWGPLGFLSEGRGPLVALLTIVCGAWLLSAEYPPRALAVVVAAIFAGYLACRWVVWMDGNRMTPRRLQVGLTWVVLGYNHANDEFDLGPVRFYFVLLAILFAGLVLRPAVQWLVWG